MIDKLKVLIFNKWMYRLFFTLFVLLLCAEFSFQYIIRSTQNQLYSTIESIPKNKVGLVLGTSKYLKNGVLNPYFKYRMEAAAKLFHTGKIEYLLLSGDNHIHLYDEPSDMENYLISLGIPTSAITKDYAGFRTFDSVIRANKVFGQSEFTIISQKFHNQRALYICNNNNIKAVAYNAKDVFSTRRNTLREYLAKFKAVLDVCVLNTQPHFLGDKIKIY